MGNSVPRIHADPLSFYLPVDETRRCKDSWRKGRDTSPPLPPLRGSSNKLEEFPVRVYIGFNDGGVKNEREIIDC